MSFIVLQNKSIISPASYLKTARKLAEIHGYEPDMLTFSKNPSKKLTASFRENRPTLPLLLSAERSIARAICWAHCT
jgi:hypothetical protein